MIKISVLEFIKLFIMYNKISKCTINDANVNDTRSIDWIYSLKYFSYENSCLNVKGVQIKTVFYKSEILLLKIQII